jgi:hypothetical protein
MFPSGGFSLIFSIVPIFIVIVFILVFGTIIISAVKGLTQWNKNNHSPILTVEANVVAKRMAVSNHTHHHGNDMAMDHHYTSTTYYVTFEFQSGDRLELTIPSQEYGYLVEGDRGRLTFQGTRFQGFERVQA